MTLDELLDQLATSGHRLASAAKVAGPDRAVRSCPGWQVADLLRHLCRVHAWAAHTVRSRPAETFVAPELQSDALLEGYRAGLEHLIKTIQGAGESPPTRAAAKLVWARRMAHETTVHLLDAELSADTGMVEVPALFAADGVDELVMGFAAAEFSASQVLKPRTITLMPLDVNRAWTVLVSAEGVRASDMATDRANLTVAGMASDLYRWAWNRAGDDVVSLGGDQRLADMWHRDFTVGHRAQQPPAP